jgi:hypothetical protein
VFVDEIALAHGRRGGRGSLENVIELAVPMLELAHAERAPIACWTIARSPVVRVLTGCFAFEIADRLGGICLLRLPAPVASDLAVIATRLPVERVRGLVGYALRTQSR